MATGGPGVPRRPRRPSPIRGTCRPGQAYQNPGLAGSDSLRVRGNLGSGEAHLKSGPTREW